MKIVFISKYLGIPSPRETGSRGFHLCNEFSKNGHEVTIILGSSLHPINGEPLKKIFTTLHFENLEVIVVKVMHFKTSKSLRRIFSWIEFEFKVLSFLIRNKFSTEVIIASSLSLLSIITAIIMKVLSKSKVVFEVRDIWPLSIITQGGFSSINPFIRALALIEKIGYRFSDHIIGTMPNLSEHVGNVAKRHPDVSCIPQGVNIEQFEFSNKESTQIYKELFTFVPQDKFIFGYSGSFGHANALDIIYQAAEKITDPRIHFVLVGDGYLKKAHISKYKQLKNVTIGPNLPRQHVKYFLNLCDALIFSTNASCIWRYGHSLNKIIDYMIAAKPIVGIYDGYDEMITEAKCGFLIKSFDIALIAKELNFIANIESSILNQMGIQGKEWLVRNRKFSDLSANYLKILENL